jgi:hypothetical protein
MTALSFYYSIRPLIPRKLQIMVRRAIAAAKRRAAESVWPIDWSAGETPPNWCGWPDNKRFALVLNHDVDTLRGHDRCPGLSLIEKNLGFRSTFFFVPEGYRVSRELRRQLQADGFGIGVHGLIHDGKMFASRKIFEERAKRVNSYLKDWGVTGFSSPSMHRKLEWIGDLDIEYDISTFDTDPFEPQPQGIGRIFPFWHQDACGGRGFVELPYTLPQDHTLFVILKERDTRIWTEKLAWIVEKGGMVLLNTHPDYMRFGRGRCSLEEYPVERYGDFLEGLKEKYRGLFWQPLALDIARFWKKTYTRADIAP